MAKGMKTIAWLSTLTAIFCALLHRSTANHIFLPLAITFGTTAYHFLMRLFIGHTLQHLLNNHVNYRAKWFQVRPAEQKLYKKLRVKKWKGKLPTYAPGTFDPHLHSWDEIAQASCQAELVHELIIPFSFLPLLAAIPFGALPVFVITSLLSALFDAMFVIIQRYNRPRILKLINHQNKT